MLHIKSLDEGLEIFKALGSNIRVEIIKILLENKSMNMNELASRLNITNGALTGHIKKLEDRYNADILWFTKGFVEYIVPNFIPFSQKIDKISISAELGSEAPSVNNVWLSDISFYINDTFIGSWTSPGDFGDVKGIFTPDWW